MPSSPSDHSGVSGLNLFGYYPWGIYLTDPQFLPFPAVEPRIRVRFHPQNLAETAAKQTNHRIYVGPGLQEFGIVLVVMADGSLTPTRPPGVFAIRVGDGVPWAPL